MTLDYSKTGTIQSVELCDIQYDNGSPVICDIENLGMLDKEKVLSIAREACVLSDNYSSAYVKVRKRAVRFRFKDNAYITMEDYVQIIKGVCDAWKYSMYSELCEIESDLVSQVTI